jgi:hypothetical protein
MRKWLNIGSNESDYSADPLEDDEDDPETDSDSEGQYSTVIMIVFLF